MATLIDELYLHFKGTKGAYGDYKNRASFLDIVFPLFEDHCSLSTPLSRSEIYTKESKMDFRLNYNCYAYICDETGQNETLNISWRVIRENAIRDFVKNVYNEGQLADLKTTLMDLLDKTDPKIHDKEIMPPLLASIGMLQTFSDPNTGKIGDKNIELWVKNIYYYFYYAVTNRLHSDLAHSMYSGLEKDLEEYNNKVTMMYGISGTPGMYLLYSLADRKDPNIIALYECGELEYYGKGPTKTVNYERAYNYYMRTKLCNEVHPLATWSIAYMRFHYSIERAKENKSYRVEQFENELKNGKTADWYETIIRNAEISYDNGCSAAANLLGKIMQCSEEEFPMALRGKYKARDAKEFFRESANAGYVFGCNNYAMCCLREAEREDNVEYKTRLMREATTWLDKSAMIGNPWAANKMGLYYYNGLTVEDVVIVDVNHDIAYERFKYARIMSLAENYYWPIINLFNYYWLNVQSSRYKEISAKEMSDILDLAIECCPTTDEYSNELDQLISIKERLNNEE